MKKHFTYIVLCSLLIVLSCKVEPKKIANRNQILVSILKDSLNLKKEYSNIFVLTEEGCMTCNKSFSLFMQKNFDNNNLYLISASGLIIDVSPFSKHVSNKEIIEMPINYIQKYQLLEGSGLIRMKNNKIDTIIALNADHLEEQLKYLENVK